ncbi:MAG: hypothetical protein KJT03_10755, partial [Verrucomicrobiae bacterium]|nr:hypothetical protein [Verrucomicrobiae bacterium]
VVMYLRADQGANRVYWPWVATGSKDLTLLAGNLETISTVDGGAFLTTQDTRISVELVHPGSSLVLVGAFISGYTNRQYFLVDPNPVVMDPDNTFYWTGKAGDSNWHLEQGQLTNWEDGNDQTALPPGNASSTEFERVVIDNADVELTDQAVTLTVINSTGSLDVRNDLELLERSDVENLKLQGGKVGIAETLKVNNGSWHFGQIQGPGKLIIPDNTLFSIRPTGVDELVLEAETDLAGTLEVFGKTLVVSEPINAKSYDLSLSGFGTLEFGNPLASGNERLKLLEDSVFTNLLRSPGRLVFNGISLSIPEDCIFNNEGVLQVLGAPLILNLGELVNRGELRIDRPVTAVLGILANYGSVIISGSEASGDYGMFFEMMPEQADAVIPELKLEQGAEVNFLNSTVIRNSPFGGMLRNMIITLDGAGSMLDFQGQGYIFNNDGEIILNNAVFKNLPFSLNTDVYSPPDVPNNSFLNQGILEIKAGFYAFQYDFENAGSLMVATGAGFESKGTFVTDENVFVEIDGQLKANEVSLLEDAYIDGTGEITANLLLFPGRIENQFADTLTLNVDMDLSDRANYDIFLDSLGFKSLDINGNINLDTQLVFHADAETVKPLIGQAIPLFRANSITGQLDSGASAGLPGWAAAEPQTLDEVVEAILKKDDSPTYSIWKSRRFNGSQIADEAYSGQTANPDNDSLINLLEFLLGGSPTGPERPDSMIESYLRELPGSDLEFEMRFPWMDRPGGSFTMEKSSDIEVWEEINIQVSDWEEGPFAGKSVKFLHGADQNAAYRVRFSFEEN